MDIPAPHGCDHVGAGPARGTVVAEDAGRGAIPDTGGISRSRAVELGGPAAAGEGERGVEAPEEKLSRPFSASVASMEAKCAAVNAS